MESSKLFGGSEESGWTSILCDSLSPDAGDEGGGHDGHHDYDDDDSLASDASSGHRNHDCSGWGDGIVSDKATKLSCYVGQHDNFDDNNDEDGENQKGYADGRDDDDDDDGDGDRNYGFRRAEGVSQKCRKGNAQRRKKVGSRECVNLRRMEESASQCSSTKGPTKQVKRSLVTRNQRA